jgi:hypothetical protein
MTSNEFNILLIELGLTPPLLARLFGVSGRTTRQWKAHGLDESAGGAQAVVSRSLRLLRTLSNQQEVIRTIQELLMTENAPAN